MDEVIAQLLVAEGFTMVEEIRDEDIAELAKIEGFEEEIAVELQNRAANYLEALNKEMTDEYEKLGTKKDLIDMGIFTPEMLVKLAREEVLTRKDLAYLSGDELVEILGTKTVTLEQANEIVMTERVSAGLIEAPEEAEGEAGDEEAAAAETETAA